MNRVKKYREYKSFTLSTLCALTVLMTLIACCQYVTSNTYGGQPVEWYDGERAPSLFKGYLILEKRGYLFTEIDPEVPTKTKYIVKFYDEDAEVEAVDIAKKNKDKPVNIELLGYPIKNAHGQLTIEVIYGIDPHKPKTN